MRSGIPFSALRNPTSKSAPRRPSCAALRLAAACADLSLRVPVQLQLQLRSIFVSSLCGAYSLLHFRQCACGGKATGSNVPTDSYPLMLRSAAYRRRAAPSTRSWCLFYARLSAPPSTTHSAVRGAATLARNNGLLRVGDHFCNLLRRCLLPVRHYSHRAARKVTHPTTFDGPRRQPAGLRTCGTALRRLVVDGSCAVCLSLSLSSHHSRYGARHSM